MVSDTHFGITREKGAADEKGARVGREILGTPGKRVLPMRRTNGLEGRERQKGGNVDRANAREGHGQEGGKGKSVRRARGMKGESAERVEA